MSGTNQLYGKLQKCTLMKIVDMYMVNAFMHYAYFTQRGLSSGLFHLFNLHIFLM